MLKEALGLIYNASHHVRTSTSNSNGTTVITGLGSRHPPPCYHRLNSRNSALRLPLTGQQPLNRTHQCV